MIHYSLLMSLITAIAFGDDPIVSIRTEKVTIGVNEEAFVILNVSVRDGYHILSNDTGNDLIPTTVDFEDVLGVEVLPAKFPEGRKFRLEGTDDFLDVYDGDFEIRIPIKVVTLRAGNYLLQGELRYQACDAKRCLFPKGLPFTVDLIII